MPRNYFNWTFNDVVKFLRNNNFRLNDSTGSHFFYLGKYNGKLRQVCVPNHGKKSLKVKTLKGIIEQSGIPKEQWLK